MLTAALYYGIVGGEGGGGKAVPWLVGECGQRALVMPIRITEM